jgi:hypothetical protein
MSMLEKFGLESYDAVCRYFGNVVKGGTKVLPRPALQLGYPIVVI